MIWYQHCLEPYIITFCKNKKAEIGIKCNYKIGEKTTKKTNSEIGIKINKREKKRNRKYLICITQKNIKECLN